MSALGRHRCGGLRLLGEASGTSGLYSAAISSSSVSSIESLNPKAAVTRIMQGQGRSTTTDIKDSDAGDGTVDFSCRAFGRWPPSIPHCWFVSKTISPGLQAAPPLQTVRPAPTRKYLTLSVDNDCRMDAFAGIHAHCDQRAPPCATLAGGMRTCLG